MPKDIDDPIKSKLLADMKDDALLMLQQQKVVHVEILHEALAEKFKRRLADYNEPLKGKRRTQAQNLIDWVKSHYTRSADVVKVREFYCYLPTAGVIYQQGSFVRHRVAADVAEVLVKVIDEGWR